MHGLHVNRRPQAIAHRPSPVVNGLYMDIHSWLSRSVECSWFRDHVRRGPDRPSIARRSTSSMPSLKASSHSALPLRACRSRFQPSDPRVSASRNCQTKWPVAGSVTTTAILRSLFIKSPRRWLVLNRPTKCLCRSFPNPTPSLQHTRSHASGPSGSNDRSLLRPSEAENLHGGQLSKSIFCSDNSALRHCNGCSSSLKTTFNTGFAAVASRRPPISPAGGTLQVRHAVPFRRF